MSRHDTGSGTAHDTGSGTAKEANARLRRLIARGAVALSLAFDLPTRLGHDSDAPPARGEVGRTGVAVDSLDDMRVLLAGIPLDRVSVSMTADAAAAPLLLLCRLVAEERGIPADRLTGTIRNDMPGSRVTGDTDRFPPGPSLRLTSDVSTYCRVEPGSWNTSAPAGRPMAGAGVCRGSRQRQIEAGQIERLAKLRAWRDQERVDRRIAAVRSAAAGQDNVLYPMKEALAAGATIGEICAALRDTWGTYPEEP
ncbi:methylmalonyl-CoA mutase family protein [Streptomyces sp. NPDC052109]|uniref:methylmalonyl-CoA mutase family protein n=1 Tax=Streptomyces sp. NPDC052109 TaxID=3155527 RepID=UPI0034316435